MFVLCNLACLNGSSKDRNRRLSFSSTFSEAKGVRKCPGKVSEKFESC